MNGKKINKGGGGCATFKIKPICIIVFSISMSFVAWLTDQKTKLVITQICLCKPMLG